MRPALLLAMLAMTLGLVEQAAADYVILSGDAEDYVEGQLLENNFFLRLRDGEHLILLSDRGDVLEVSGPFEGSPQGTRADDFDLRSALTSLIDNPNLLHARLGSTRSGGVGSDPEAAGPSVWYLDPEADGGQCAIDDETIVFWRTSTDKPLSLTVQRPGIDGSGELSWQAGESAASWPTEIPAESGELYVLRRPGWMETTLLHLALLPKAIASQPETAVAWLAINGCKRQAELLLAQVD